MCDMEMFQSSDSQIIAHRKNSAFYRELNVNSLSKWLIFRYVFTYMLSCVVKSKSKTKQKHKEVGSWCHSVATWGKTAKVHSHSKQLLAVT